MAHLLHFVVGLVLLLHVVFWGAGVAMLAMPRPWRRFWPAVVVPAGLALQSAVVWFAALAGLRGTNHYAWGAELVPLALLAFALWRQGWRAHATNVGRFGLVWLQMIGVLLLLILPLAIASRGLTTIALSSCDAGDYAGGARTLMEFARSDRDGFLGLTEVVRVASADNFFDFWLRLNHFTPSALIAFNGTVLDCQPHELTSLLGMVLVAGSLPVVFWVARAIFGYSGGVSLIVALLYGLSPITWYAAMQVALGQLLAAQAIALLSWTGIALWRGKLTARRARQFVGVLCIGYWLVLGSYNFIVIVCLVPAVAYAGGLAIWRGQWPRLGRWAAAMLLPLVACGLVFFGRVSGLAERFTLLRTYDFGWRIAPLTPEGWLGLVRGPEMEAWSFFGLRWALAALVGVPWIWAMVRSVKQRRPGAWTVASIILPVLFGYAFLEERGARLGTNASYDAYKLFAVFLPLLLAAFCWWLTLRRSRRITEWFGVMGLAAVVVVGNLLAAGMTIWRMAQPPLIVDNALRHLRRLEEHPEVTSVNVLLDQMWERLWANAFLLRKPQYFLTTSYEARWATPLKGEWDLRGGMIQVAMPEPDANVVIDDRYRATRRTAHALEVEFGDGWYDEERVNAQGEPWRWSKYRATLRFNNPQNHPLRVQATFDWRGVRTTTVDFAIPGWEGALFGDGVEAQRKKVQMMAWEVPAGRSEWVIHAQPAPGPKLDDPRELGVCLFGLKLQVLP